MAESSAASASSLSDRSLAVALITITRYLADKDPSLTAYLQASLDHARASSLSEEDLATLKLIINAIGVSPQARSDRVAQSDGTNASAN